MPFPKRRSTPPLSLARFPLDSFQQQACRGQLQVHPAHHRVGPLLHPSQLLLLAQLPRRSSTRHETRHDYTSRRAARRGAAIQKGGRTRWFNSYHHYQAGKHQPATRPPHHSTGQASSDGPGRQRKADQTRRRASRPPCRSPSSVLPLLLPPPLSVRVQIPPPQPICRPPAWRRGRGRGRRQREPWRWRSCSR